jgi:hypothetical protein
MVLSCRGENPRPTVCALVDFNRTVPCVTNEIQLSAFCGQLVVSVGVKQSVPPLAYWGYTRSTFPWFHVFSYEYLCAANMGFASGI